MKKGIPADKAAADVIRAFQGNPWAVTHLLEQGMVIDSGNYGALHACINTGNTQAAQMLLERGMDFGHYTEWAEANSRYRPLENKEAFEAVREYWKQCMDSPDSDQRQSETPQIGGMSL